MTRQEVLDKARDLIAPVLGASTCTALLDKLLALENVKDVHELRPLLQKELIEDMPVEPPSQAKHTAATQETFYTGLSFQVLAGVAIAIILGYVNPPLAASMKPLGDVFIRMITMIITLVIFCTLVTGSPDGRHEESRACRRQSAPLF